MSVTDPASVDPDRLFAAALTLKMTDPWLLRVTIDWDTMGDLRGCMEGAVIDKNLKLAVALHNQGQFSRAQAIYEQILRVEPRHFDALHLLGVIAAQTGNPAKAADMIAKALQIVPHSPVAHKNRGAALQELGLWEAALASYERAAALDANYAEPHYHRGNVFKQLRRLEQAVACYDRAILVRADYFEAYYNRGNVFCLLRRWQDAVRSYDRAIELRAGFASAHSNRAFALQELGRHEEALASCELALQIDPGSVDGHVNRAGVLMSMDRVEEALASYDLAISLNPARASVYVNRGLARLSAGDFLRGWQDYEWRWRDHEGWIVQEKRNFPQEPWLGETSLEGKTILLQAEQGHGDTIQFCRYAPLVAALGARVILEAPAALASLLQSLDGVAQVVVQGDPIPPFDTYCPLLSLPLAMRTRLDGLPAAVPYLRPSEAHRCRWKEPLSLASGPRVGLVWSGGFRPGRPELWSANSRRNIPVQSLLQSLAGLADSGVEFYSLQKGQPAESELSALRAHRRLGADLKDLTREIHDFADTAALIERLDLVISVDTATAHLAGALGRPVWILNRFDACWRWLRNRSDSPWYPTARLYRQPRAGDWDGVLDRVKADLAEYFGGWSDAARSRAGVRGAD